MGPFLLCAPCPSFRAGAKRGAEEGLHKQHRAPLLCQGSHAERGHLRHPLPQQPLHHLFVSQNKTRQRDRAAGPTCGQALATTLLPQSQQHPLHPPSCLSQKQQPELPEGQHKPEFNPQALSPFLKSFLGWAVGKLCKVRKASKAGCQGSRESRAAGCRLQPPPEEAHRHPGES